MRSCQKLLLWPAKPVPVSSRRDLLLAKTKTIRNDDTKVSGREGGDASGTGVEIPLQLVVQTIVNLTDPLQTMEVNRSEEIHLQPVEKTHIGASGCPKEAAIHEKPMLEQGPGRDLLISGERSLHWSIDFTASFVPYLYHSCYHIKNVLKSS
ncbi:hypothetical protein WISP_36330 [Willisornis vidua]|uniref:Uncharacterized protein n=1 Tax=Willisornis vidua TaxID=1566151 RepID=A0ABQ9DIH5_9PASS|nr:hypothetical protein WISP_36330 [Willisornis vidua]